MSSVQQSLAEFMASLSPDREQAVEGLRAFINENVDPLFEEGVQNGMLSWVLPHAHYPHGYHCDPSQPLPFISIAAQKNSIGLYLFCIYANPDEQERFQKEWQATGKRLDMGKACVRIKRLEDVPLKVLGGLLRRMTAKRFVRAYEAGLPDSVKAKRARAAAKAGGLGTGPKAKGKMTVRRPEASTKKVAATKQSKPARARRA